MATPLIARNTPISVKRSEIFITAADMRTSVTIHVFQGERPMAPDNTSLGQFNLDGLPPAPRSVPTIEVTFDTDADGILNVTAKDTATGKAQSIRIIGSTRLLEAKKRRMIEQAERFADDDKKRCEDTERPNAAAPSPCRRGRRRGAPHRLRAFRPVTCPACGGSRVRPDKLPRPCSACGGTSRRSRSQRKGSVSIQQITICAECQGERQSIREQTLTVRIPVGIEAGAAFRVPAHGMPGPGAGAAGDLYAVVRTAPDSRFAQQGTNLWRTEIIEIVDAVLGRTLTVLTLDGNADVKVLAGAQPDSVRRLRGKGLPELGGGRQGDLFQRLQVHIPERTPHKERAAYEKLRALKNTRR